MERDRPIRSEQHLPDRGRRLVGQREGECGQAQRRGARPHRPEPEIVLQRTVGRFQREVHRRQVGEEHESEPAYRERERPEPRANVPAHKRPGGRPHVARGDRTYGDAEEDGRDQARRGEQAPPAALGVVPLGVVGPEGEGRAPEHDADQHQREGDVQRDRQQREGRWKAGE